MIDSLDAMDVVHEGLLEHLLSEELSKVSFDGDRSAAGRYAANMRWKGRAGEGTGFVSPTKMPRPLLLDGQGHNMLQDDVGVIKGLPSNSHLTPTQYNSAELAKREVVKGIVAGMTDVSEEEISEACLELFGSPSALFNINIHLSTAEQIAAAPRIDKQKLVQYFVDRWAVTSNDSQRDSLMVQQVVQKVFGLDDAFQITALTEVDNPVGTAEYDREAKEVLQNPVVEKVLTSFVKAQYANTQAYLKSKGITEVMVFRGMNHPELAEELHDYRLAHFERMSERGEITLEDDDDGVERYSGDITDEEYDRIVPEGVVNVNMRMRPLSAFSVSKYIATQFGPDGPHGDTEKGIFLSAKVPAARIFSTPLTGVGCFDEDEFVVLGGFLEGTASKSSSGDFDYNYDDMFRSSDPNRVTTYG